MANVDDQRREITIFHGNDTLTETFTSDQQPLRVNSLALAALTDALIELGITHDNSSNLPAGLLRMLLSHTSGFISSRK